MKFRIIVTMLLLLAAAAPASGLEIMKTSDVKAGMKGTGYSVFSGTMPEPFSARIIDVVKKAHSGHDLIIAELAGANLEESGIIAGMSGSPVYIDGKLIGAVAYAWGWAKRPIAGITPIEQMLELWDDLDKEEKRGDAGAGISETMYALEGGATGRFTPISTPLMVGGMDDETIAYLSKALGKYGIVPTMGGGIDDGEELPGMDDLKPGHVISCPLITGDITATAIGTVTAREGDRVLAFGHPFFNMGPVSIPMGGGYISLVMPVQNVSFKIGRAGKVLGLIKRDHNPAIAGVVGEPATFFPVTINISDPQLDRKETFSVKIAWLKELSPSLLLSAIGQSVRRVSGASSDVTVEYTMTGNFKNYDRPMKFTDMYYSPGGFYSSSAAQYVLALLENDFRDMELADVAFDITVRHDRKTLDVVEFTLNKNKFLAGEEVTANVRLREYNEKEVYRQLAIKLPENLQPGKYTLFVEGGYSISGQPSLAPINDFKQYFEILDNWIPSNTLSVRMVYPDMAVGVNGREMKGLPLTVRDAMTRIPSHNMNTFERYERKVFAADAVISGVQTATIFVDKEF